MTRQPPFGFRVYGPANLRFRFPCELTYFAGTEIGLKTPSQWAALFLLSEQGADVVLELRAIDDAGVGDGDSSLPVYTAESGAFL